MSSVGKEKRGDSYSQQSFGKSAGNVNARIIVCCTQHLLVYRLTIHPSILWDGFDDWMVVVIIHRQLCLLCPNEEEHQQHDSDSSCV